jgi:membrane protease YdiL (CAAX protease family)
MNVNRFYAFAAVWGLVDAVGVITFIGKGRSGGTTAVGIVVELVAAAIVFMAGRQAKRDGGRPWRVGAIAGLLFGLFAGWSAFLIHITRQELVSRAHNLTPSQISLALKAANSPVAHVGAWVVAMIEGLILGIILGWIGGMTGRSPTQNQDV